MRVLIAEDDRALGLFLEKGLRLEGHEVEWVGDGEAALERALAWSPDLLVLDLGLPRRDGTEVLSALGEAMSEAAVLVLTGRGEVEERVRCLNLGADDFLTKPFSFHELTARCRAILRRRQRYQEPVLRWGGLELDRLRRRVLRDGIAVELTGKEFALLEFLMLRGGACCTRTELLREIWRMEPESGTNVLDVYVNYLRRKLTVSKADGAEPLPLIDTVRGSGYRMAAAARRVPAAQAQAIAVNGPVVAASAELSNRWRVQV
jgi:DNA-binding response OmpR family regulator